MLKLKKYLLFLLLIVSLVCVCSSCIDLDSLLAINNNDSKDQSQNNKIATEIELNTLVTDNLSNSSEKDSFSFNIPEDGYIEIEFTHENVASTQNHWCMDVYMSDATTGYGRTEGRTYWDIVGNEDFTSPQMGVSEGTYYIEIQRSYSAFSSLNYDITVNYTQSPDWETEVNNTYDRSDVITVNEGGKKASIVKGDDVDWYRLNTYGSRTLTFTHAGTDSTKNCWVVTIYSSDGVTQIGKFEVYGTQRSTNYKFDASGTVYIKITSGYIKNFEEYAINVS